MNGEYLFGDREKEVLRKMMWQAADFSGVEVLTYALMDNHFHILVRVPDSPTPASSSQASSGQANKVKLISDAELMRRWRRLYPKPTKYETASALVMERKLAKGGEEAEVIRKRLLSRMHDVSEFMKTLKQRFTIWFNQSHGRFGTLWAERFKSVLVEGHGPALQTTGAYIDLNPVRAGLVKDPKDYRFCGFAEAVAHSASSERIHSTSSGQAHSASSGQAHSASSGQGEKGGCSVSEWTACDGICFIWRGYTGVASQEVVSIKSALQMHREFIFGKRAGESGLSETDRQKALQILEKSKGCLPRATVLRCRVRYFTDGVILGSEDYVRGFAERWQQRERRKKCPKPVPLRGADWGGLANLQTFRRQVFG